MSKYSILSASNTITGLSNTPKSNSEIRLLLLKISTDPQMIVQPLPLMAQVMAPKKIMRERVSPTPIYSPKRRN